MDRIPFRLSARIQIHPKISTEIHQPFVSSVPLPDYSCVCLAIHPAEIFIPLSACFSSLWDGCGSWAFHQSPSLLNYASLLIPVKGDYYHLARFLVSVSGFWGIGGMALVSSFWHFPFFEDNVILKGLALLLASLFFPFFIGYLFHFLTLRKTSEKDLLVYLLGLVFFTSGVAAYFNLPSLFVCMVLGITYSNLTRIQEKIYPLLLSTEKPFYIIFLILIGALWDFSFDYKIAILVVFLLVSKIIGSTLPLRFFEKILHFSFPLPSLFGFCFLSSGGVAIAFIISWKLIYQLPLTDVFVSVALITTVASEFLSPWVLKSAILRLDSEK
jgi:hypothetical protein